MNREIKFRFWNGYEIKPVRVINFNYDFYEDDHSHISDVEDIEKSPFLMQYTGLKDKNGKEIYEGDIITYQNFIKFIGIVWWYDKSATYLVDLSQNKNKFINTSNHQITLSSVLGGDNDTEVIGNIYENPEMLKSDE